MTRQMLALLGFVALGLVYAISGIATTVANWPHRVREAFRND